MNLQRLIQHTPNAYIVNVNFMTVQILQSGLSTIPQNSAKLFVKAYAQLLALHTNLQTRRLMIKSRAKVSSNQRHTHTATAKTFVQCLKIQVLHTFSMTVTAGVKLSIEAKKAMFKIQELATILPCRSIRR